jgi:hypothetical protein
VFRLRAGRLRRGPAVSFRCRRRKRLWRPCSRADRTQELRV